MQGVGNKKSFSFSGQRERKDMEQNFGIKVNLKTWVKVKEDWVNNEKIFKPKE